MTVEYAIGRDFTKQIGGEFSKGNHRAIKHVMQGEIA